MSGWQPFEELMDVDSIIAKISDHQSGLFAEESTHVASAVPGRIREFTAGRSLARLLLGRRELPPKSIPVGPGGQPVWPEHIVGSISHAASYAGVAITSTRHYRGLGMDIEVPNAAGTLDAGQILTEREAGGRITDLTAEHRTRIFSCKEAVFKAVFPISGEHLEFLDIEIEFTGNGFGATVRKATRAASAVASGRGLIDLRDGLLATIFCIR